MSIYIFRVKILNTTDLNVPGQNTPDIMYTGKNTTGQNPPGQNVEKYLPQIGYSNMTKIQLDIMFMDKISPGQNVFIQKHIR